MCVGLLTEVVGIGERLTVVVDMWGLGGSLQRWWVCGGRGPPYRGGGHVCVCLLTEVEGMCVCVFLQRWWACVCEGLLTEVVGMWGERASLQRWRACVCVCVYLLTEVVGMGELLTEVVGMR